MLGYVSNILCQNMKCYFFTEKKRRKVAALEGGAATHWWKEKLKQSWRMHTPPEACEACWRRGVHPEALLKFLFSSVCAAPPEVQHMYFLLRFSVKQYFFNCSFLLLVNKYKKIYHPCEQGSKKFSSKIMNNTSNRESAESWKMIWIMCKCNLCRGSS